MFSMPCFRVAREDGQPRGPPRHVRAEVEHFVLRVALAQLRHQHLAHEIHAGPLLFREITQHRDA